jgi:hypothetical protein
MPHRRLFLSSDRRLLLAAVAMPLLSLLIPLRDVNSQAAPGAAGAALVRKYANTDLGFRLLRESPVRSALVRLLGDRLQQLEHNLDVSGSVDVIDGSLAVSGIAPHQGGEQEGIVCIVSYDLSVHAAILSGRTIELFTPAASYTNVPLCIKDWITQINSGHRDRFDPPGNVRIVTRH